MRGFHWQYFNRTMYVIDVDDLTPDSYIDVAAESEFVGRSEYTGARFLKIIAPKPPA